MTRSTPPYSSTVRLPLRPLSLLALGLMLAGCTINPNPDPLPGPIRPPLKEQKYDSKLQAETVRDEQARKAKRFQMTPGQRRQGPTYVEASADSLGQHLTGEPISLNLNNFPLPAFINEVFGNRLGLSFSISPALQEKTDLVSLRLSEPQPPAALFATARFVLADYGVAVSERDGVLFFQPAENAPNDTLPLLVSGNALPDVPMSHRPVFQQIPMRVVRSDSMVKWLNDMFTDSSLKISSDALTNSVLLRGPIDLIRQASQAIELFDRPALKGSYSMAISPMYSDAEQLGAALIKVLQAEGYDVSENPPMGGVVVLKLKELQRIIVFSADPNVLTTARQWVDLLDRQSQEQVENGLFVYQVRNTQAASLATMLGALGYSATIPDTSLGSGNTISPTGKSTGSDLTNGKTSGSNAGTTSSGKGPRTMEGNPGQGSLVVDANRNALIYKGSGQEWLKLRPLLDELDRPVPSVMIDVLLAEVNLNDKEGLGVDWKNITANIGAKDLLINTANGLGSSGLSLALNSAGQTKAALNAFYNNQQAVIRSSPKLMVRSGEEASIEVGNEIPVVTGSSQSTDNANAPITQTVQYRKTGVLLNIKPTVQASGVVDLQINQELSEQTDTSTTSLTPTINNRKIETALTLRDGGSVMLAGLISSNKGKGDTGVPLLGDIPWVGSFFKSTNNSATRTELIVMIIPYIVRDFDEAQHLSSSYRQMLPLNSSSSLERRGSHRLPPAYSQHELDAPPPAQE